MARYIVNPDSICMRHPSGYMREDNLAICELFIDAVQGEGAYAGCPSVFLRLSGCHLRCSWCDTSDIWHKSEHMHPEDLVRLFRNEGIIRRLEKGHHLIITGGSPLLQQDQLTSFLTILCGECADKPFIEIENDCSIPVKKSNRLLWSLADCWNNSPKLSNSDIPKERRYNPEALVQMAMAHESWFKFVVQCEDDWNEIETDFISTGYVHPSNIILMPQGQTREELSPAKKETVMEMAVRHNVRYGGRLQIDVYDNRKGV